MVAPTTVLLALLALSGAGPTSTTLPASDSLAAYRAALGRAMYRTATTTTRDVTDRLRQVVAPAQFDSLQAALLYDVEHWAEAETRYYAYIGADPATCPLGREAHGDACGNPDRRFNPQAQTLRYQWRLARDQALRTWLVLGQRLRTAAAADAPSAPA